MLREQLWVLSRHRFRDVMPYLDPAVGPQGRCPTLYLSGGCQLFGAGTAKSSGYVHCVDC